MTAGGRKIPRDKKLLLDLQDTPDNVVREAAALQEARALRMLFASRRGHPVLSLQDFLRLLEIVQACRGLLCDLVGDAAGVQVVANPGTAVLAGKRTSAFFSEALVRKLLLGLQEINNGIDGCFRLRVRQEVAHQLGPRVLPPYEESQRPRLELRGRVRLIFQPSDL